MDKILITSGIQPFAQRVGGLLKARYQVAYASSEPFPDLLLKQGYLRIPTGANPTFAHEILKRCLDQGYRWVLPLGSMEVQPLYEAQVLLEEYGITVLLPDQPEDRFVLESPTGALKVLHAGRDMLTDEKFPDTGFSGVGMLSDSGEEPVWCLV